MSKWTIAKETVDKLSEQAPRRGVDAAGMLEALISKAIGALAAEQGVACVKNFIDYEVGSINVQHVDV